MLHANFSSAASTFNGSFPSLFSTFSVCHTLHTQGQLFPWCVQVFMQTGALPLAPPNALTIVSPLLSDEVLQVPTPSASKKLIQETQQGRRPRSGYELWGSSLRLSTPSIEAPHIPRRASLQTWPFHVCYVYDSYNSLFLPFLLL